MSELAGITTCRLPHPKLPGQECGQKFTGPAHIIIGEGAPGRMKALFERLVIHLHSEHQQYFAQVMLQGEEYKGLLWMLAFKTSDPELKEQCDYLRWTIHQRTLNARVTDEKLKAGVAAIVSLIMEDVCFWVESGQHTNLRQQIADHIQNEMRAIRDALQEPVAPPNPLAPKVTA